MVSGSVWSVGQCGQWSVDQWVSVVRVVSGSVRRCSQWSVWSAWSVVVSQWSSVVSLALRG